jgi:glucan phosphoethanolaminetransferase (alkaline phosphatase superfamily)
MVSNSNLSEIILRVTSALFYIVPILVFIILAIYYINKNGSTKEGLLVLIGNILILIVAIIHRFLYTFIDSWGFDVYAIINTGVNAISFIGSILFLIGFYMMIQKIIKNKVSE